MSTIEKITITDKILKLTESAPITEWGKKERDLAIEAFSRQGIPNRKSEEYKYVNVELMLKAEFDLATADKILTNEQIEHLYFLKNAYTVVIENGNYIEALSNIQQLPKGLTISSLGTAAKDHTTVFEKHFSNYADIHADSFIALNTAMATDGVFILIEKNTVIEKPIHILHISTAKNNIRNNG